ncbi:2OG-Fe(II) oxygenase family protein [Aromatoleum toluolicum]|uniref:Hydroxylase n=1 Tax=Aromatoleum toluolicum TaxID=90060 RepID=A0ABX1NK67_9RHOO|nr:2OG-Fe(II) oxygenase family protein [Aromatoleum toluolicum]NMF99574.1 2OG-Fe(II) oxygenase family protein [Aromatoleum toluolicum]
MAREINRWSASDVIAMFPTLVWKVQLKPELHAAMDGTLLAALDEMRRTAAPLAPGQGWQSEQMLHRRPEFAELVACVDGLAKSVTRFLRLGYDAVEITGCWANVLAPGAAHRMHSHPNNFLSGVYYVRVPPDADCINFHDPRPQAAIIRPPVVELTAENTDQVVVNVRSGTLLMFPSYLQHSVDANQGAQERVSISFNLMFSAFSENVSKPLW